MLIALLLLLVFYPFRLRVRYGKTNPERPFGLQIHILGPFGLVLGVPIGEQTSGQETPDDDEGDTPGEVEMAPSRDPLAQLLSAAQFIPSVFFDPEDRGDIGGEMGPAVKLVGPKAFLLYFVRTCENLSWKTRVGTTDAASTALCVGTLWAIKTGAHATLSRNVRFLHTPHFVVMPEWEEAVFEIDIDCIFRFRLGEIILAWIDGSVRKWKKGVHRFGHGERPSH